MLDAYTVVFFTNQVSRRDRCPLIRLNFFSLHTSTSQDLEFPVNRLVTCTNLLHSQIQSLPIQNILQ